MRALVTGAAGFVGRHMTEELIRRGYTVARCDTALGWDAHTAFAGGGLRFDLVVHAAAAEPHRAAIDGKPILLAANLHLDAAMFEWAVRTHQRRVLYLSSSAAYPVALQDDPKWGRLVEEDADPFSVRDPDANYGWTKLTGERMAAAANEAGVPTHIVRPFSGYGEDQSLNFPFPAIVDRARKGDLTVWGPPGQTRDWIHVSDLVAAALAVVEHDERRPVNLCTGRGVEMGELAYIAARSAGHGAGVVGEWAPIVYQPDKPTGVLYRVGDPTRLHEHYRPKISIEEGVRRALA